MSGVLFVSRCHPADSEVISSTPVIHRFLTKNPKVMGTHFFSPANVMQLLENVRTSNLAVRFFGIKQQKLGGLSHYLQGFIHHPNGGWWLFGISSIYGICD